MSCKKFLGAKARDITLTALTTVTRTGQNVDDILHELFDRFQVSPAEKPLAYEITCGVIRRKITLDAVISRLSRIKFKRLQPAMVNVLRIGLYQLLYLEGVPDYAAVNETVKQARKKLNPGAAGFVNALLRKFISSGKNVEYPSRAENASEYISIKHSHPRWLVEKWLKTFGEEKTEQLCRINNLPPAVFIRANQLKISPQELVKQLSRERVGAEIIDQNLGALRLDLEGKISELDTFRRGYFYVQDLTAMQVAPFSSPVEGKPLLDVCAAPGGKSTHAAELMNNTGIVISIDKNMNKIDRLLQNISRLAAVSITPVVADASRLSHLFKNKTFDRAILDAPCSNTGVFRRRIEARWRLKPEDFVHYHQLQLRFLLECAPLLKKNGILVYSTCSIDSEENEQVVEEFLNCRTDYNLLEQKSFFPSEHSGDGGFMARLKHK